MPDPGLDLAVLLGYPPGDAPSCMADARVAARLAAQIDPARAGAKELLKLPPAEFVACAYAIFFGRPPDAQTFTTLRDRLLLGQTSAPKMLRDFQAGKTTAAEISGLAPARFKETLHRSPPAQLALALARLGRNVRRLPGNLRRSMAPKDQPGFAPPGRARAAIAGRPRIAVVASTSSSPEVGGAERFYLGLCEALEAAGMAVDLVAQESREGSICEIRQSYRRFYDLDVSAYDGVISTKAPSYAVRHPNHVCFLVHTMRAYYDMFAASHPYASNRMVADRRHVQALDTAALQTPRHLFAIGEEVAARLRRFNGLDAQVLRFPSPLTGLQGGEYRHLFLPGRLHPWKRVDLAIAAMRFVRAPVPLIIAGAGQEEIRLRALAKSDTRIHFTGRITDEKLAALYGEALAVVFVPRQEDLGLITLEAFACEKPVICCGDSGEPARMVKDGESGFVCPPDPRRIAERIEALAGEPSRAAAMGKAGAASIAEISWDHTARTLCRALGFQPA